MSYTEKIDILDLIINILKEHEEKLDGLVARLEEITDDLKAHTTEEASQLVGR